MSEQEIFDKIAGIMAAHFEIEKDKITKEMNFKKE